jgi:methionyl-tRNA formyltransferase
LRLILDRASAVPSDERDVPGTVLAAAGDLLVVATGSGDLAVERVQPAGKRVLSAAEFLRGYPVQRGERFGNEN